MAGLSAHATKARLQALGQDDNGSLFIRDERNIFLNPATINSYTDRLNLEAGKTDRVTSSAAASPNDTTNSPKAEGGLIYKLGELTAGAQLGRVSDAAQRIDDQNALGAVDFFDPQNSFDLLLGGKGGIAWGASLHHAFSKDDGSAAGNPNQEARVLSARGGVQADRFQAYGVLDVMHESKITKTAPDVTQKYDGNLSLEAGGSFELNRDSSVGGFIRQTGYDFDDGAASKGDDTNRELKALYFHRFRQEENVFVFGSAGLYWKSEKVDFDGAGVTSHKFEETSIPCTLGLETRAASWLKFRGSVTQSVLIHQTKTRDGTIDNKQENMDSTIVTLGTGVVFDKFTLDATLKGSGAAGNGQVDGTNLMANAGLSYEF
jgi:hypothetical protein